MRRISRREEHKSYKLNIFKVAVVLILLAIIIFSIYNSLFKNKKTDNTHNNNSETDVSINNDESNSPKTIDEIIAEFGGEIEEKVKEDTYYINKEGKSYTVYADGDIVEGKMLIWDGTSSEPAIDEAGNYNIYKPQELKWIADKIITGEKNFGGVTITLRDNLDFGARPTEQNEWDGNMWTSMIGFLDELAENSQNIQEENTNNNEEIPVEQQAENVDPNIDITEENLKRFAGIFNGNNFWIKGIYVNSEKRYQGLFGYQTGTIQNLTIKNSKIIGGEGTGGIVGLNGGTIVNCHTENVEVYCSNKNKVGGISGINMTGSWIENCSTEGSAIYGANYVGGITGYMNNNSAIISSSNSSSVGGTDFIGGISGITFYGTQIKNCSNTSINISGTNYIGGIVGYSQSDIENSYNQSKGAVCGVNYVGGLVGLNYLMGNITSSFNNCDIVSINSGEHTNFGGIVGLNNANISNCYNTGKITIEGNDSKKVGGICGQNLSESFIYNSYNIGKIECKNASGDVDANFGEISNCFYLNSVLTSNENNENSKDENQMKSEILSKLGDEFKEDTENKNNGYPILNWQ